MSAEFFEKVYLTKGITVGEAPKYSAWEHEFAKYKGQIPKTRSLTKYTPDAVFLPEGKKEAWVIETQFELNYEAVGQALAYWYAYERVKRGISGLTFSNPSREKETQNVSQMLHDRQILPKVVCLAAPEDFRALCAQLKPSIQVFYCEEANAAPRSHWRKTSE